MKITIEHEMPINPPKRVVLELTEDEALTIAAIMGNLHKGNRTLDDVHNIYFNGGIARQKIQKVSYQTVMSVLELYNNIPKELGYK